MCGAPAPAWAARMCAQELVIRMQAYQQTAAPVACQLSMYVGSAMVSRHGAGSPVVAPVGLAVGGQRDTQYSGEQVASY